MELPLPSSGTTYPAYEIASSDFHTNSVLDRRSWLLAMLMASVISRLVLPSVMQPKRPSRNFVSATWPGEDRRGGLGWVGLEG